MPNIKPRPAPQVSPEHDFLDWKYIKAALKKPNSTLYRWQAEGLMPRMVKIGPNSSGMPRSVFDEYASDPEAWRAAHPKSAVAG